MCDRAAALAVGSLLVASCGAAPPALEADLDGDGRRERVVLDARRDPTVIVSRGGHVLWSGIPRRWSPWRVVLADVDGDGRREIVLGVHKATRFFPEPHNALFVYGFADGAAVPRWLGSRLSRPFDDFLLGDLDGDRAEELVALEQAADGGRCLAVYAWSGFGFDGRWRRCGWKKLRLLAVEGKAIVVEGDGRTEKVKTEVTR